MGKRNKKEEAAAKNGPEPKGEEDESWEIGPKKGKKKEKKESSAEPEAGGDSVTDILAESHPAADFESGAFGTKKNKKKDKKNILDGSNAAGEDDNEPGEFAPNPPPETETHAETEWGSATTKKNKKKGKKGLADNLNPVEGENEGKKESLVDAAQTELDADINWDSFTTSKNKKKGKKSEIDDLNPIAEEHGDGNELDPNTSFKTDPDLDFGFSFSGAKKKDKKNKKKLLADTTETAEGGIEEANESMSTSLHKGGGFNFGWDASERKSNREKDIELDNDDLDATLEGSKVGKENNSAANEPQDAEDYTWGTFGTKKNQKKSKKNNLKGSGLNHEEQTDVNDKADPQSIDVAWSSLGTQKDKIEKKTGIDKKATAQEDQQVNDVGEDDQVGLDTSTSFAWGTFGMKKEKKKGKKTNSNDVDAPSGDFKVQDAGDDQLGLEPNADLGVASFEVKKEKKNGKNNTAKDAEHDIHTSKYALSNEDPPAEDTFSPWGSAAKKGKKGKKGDKKDPVLGGNEDPAPAIESIADVPLTGPDLKPDAEAEGTKNSKKGKKGAQAELKQDSAGAGESILGVSKNDTMLDHLPSWGAKGKKDKKNKSIGMSEAKNELTAEIDTTAATNDNLNVTDATWMNWDTEKKKDKMEKEDYFSQMKSVDFSTGEGMFSSAWGTTGETTGDPMLTFDFASGAGNTSITNKDWGAWDVTNKPRTQQAKAELQTAINDESYSFLPPTETKTNPSTSNLWGAPKKEKDKKGKKGKNAETEPSADVPDVAKDSKLDFFEDDLGGWGLSTKERKKKEKEKEKEEKEKEEKEKEEKEKEQEKEKEKEQEKEEQEKRESEENEKKQKAEEEQREKSKLKAGKKGKTAGASTSSKTRDLLENSTTDVPSKAEEDVWTSWGGSIGKERRKDGRKPIVSEAPPPPAPTPPVQGLTPEPRPELLSDLDNLLGDNWDAFAAGGTKEKKGSKKATKGLDTEAHQDITPANSEDVITEALLGNTKDEGKESAAKAARGFWGGMSATSTSKTKPIKDKEKEKDGGKTKKKELLDEEPKDLVDIDLNADPVMGVINEPVKSGGKAKAEAKLTKVNSKESDKASSKTSDKKKKNDANSNRLTEVHEEVAEVTNATGPSGDGDSDDDANVDADADANAFTPAADEQTAWSFLGTSKKTAGNSGKKGGEPKKEIAKQSVTNEMDSLNDISNEPELSLIDDQPAFTKTTKTSKANMLSTKSTVKTSVAQRVKALEKGAAKDPEPVALSSLKDSEPLAKTEPPVKKASAASKAKATATGKSTSSNKKDPWSDPWSAAEEDPKDSFDSVPGSFPVKGATDDIIDTVEDLPIPKKSGKKSSKKDSAMDLMDFEQDSPIPPPAPDAPPTPPLDLDPEPETEPEPAVEKPPKKERARVVRDEGASSWGFWGTAPKKPTKKDAKPKDGVDPPTSKSAERPPAPLVRSKSMKTPKEKETEKSSAKSSSSDKEKKTDPRPSKSRPSGFGSFFGGPPPSRSKPVRRHSTAAAKPAASRRQSIDIGNGGLPSPPPEEVPEMSAKASKIMGTSGGKLGRKESTRRNPKASGKFLGRGPSNLTESAKHRRLAVPDPYPIDDDDDDMVMVNGLEDPIIDVPTSQAKDNGKAKGSKGKSKKEVSSREFPKTSRPSHTIGRGLAKFAGSADEFGNIHQAEASPELADDIVMVDASRSQDEAELPTMQDALAFDVEKPIRPTPIQRSSTNSRKSSSKLMGLFGGFQKSRRPPESDRRMSKAVAENEEGDLRRKRVGAAGGDGVKRIRRDDRKVRRPEKPDLDGDGLVTDAPPENMIKEVEEVDGRKEEPRARRTSKTSSSKQTREVEGRHVKRRAADDDSRRAQDQTARKVDEAEAVRHDARRVRRIIKEDEVPRDLAFDVGEKRTKRRDRDIQEKDTYVYESSSRPHKTDHRRSDLGKPRSPSAESPTTTRRPHGARRTTTGDRSSRRRSTTTAEYDAGPGNGVTATAGEMEPPLAPLDEVPPPEEPYMHGANDHTSSWVKSQITEPPPPPPIEPSVLDPAPVLGGVAMDGDAGEEARRAARRREKRQSKYGKSGGDEVDKDAEYQRRRRRRTEKDVRSSEGSGEGDKDRRRSDARGYTSRGLSSGGGASKRSSWFKKIAGLQA